MNTSAQSIKDWQGWFDLFREIYSTSGFMEFIDIASEDNEENWDWMPRYMIPVQTSLCSAMLTACLQLPPDQIEKTLASMVKAATDQRFDKSPRGLKKKLKELYQSITRELTRIVPPMSEMVAAVLKSYMRDNYDVTEDVNLKMRQAVSLFSSRNRAEAFQIVSQAGAAVLCGSHIWDGWLSEGSGELETWVLSIIVMRNVVGSLLPLQSYAEMRLKANDVAAMLLASLAEPEIIEDVNESETDESDESEDPNEDEMVPYLDEIAQMCLRTEPFTDDEIKEMGDKYDLYGKIAAQSIAPFMSLADEDEAAADVMRVFVTTLGLLRYPALQSIQMLILLVSRVHDQIDDETISEAVTALKRIGPPALPQVFDFARYSSREVARADMLTVLGVVGRGSEEVFDYLLKQFTEATWLGDKIDYALPLALTHDPRVIGHIAEALHEPSLDEDDAWELLDALQELNVTFYVNHDNRSVNIPDYGIIEDVLPTDWRTRKELDEEAEEEDEWGEDWESDDPETGADEDDLDDDDDDEVVYDENGVPRCPGCGAEMHYVDGSWVHEEDLVEPKSIKPQIKPVGRNDPCPCGSGKKYKYCHGRGE